MTLKERYKIHFIIMAAWALFIFLMIPFIGWTFFYGVLIGNVLALPIPYLFWVSDGKPGTDDKL